MSGKPPAIILVKMTDYQLQLFKGMNKSRAKYMRDYRYKKCEEKLNCGWTKPKKVARTSTERSRDFRARRRKLKLPQTPTAVPTSDLSMENIYNPNPLRDPSDEVYYEEEPIYDFSKSTDNTIKVVPGLTFDTYQNDESIEDTKDLLAGCSRLEEEPNPDSMNEEHLESTIDIGSTTYIKQENDNYLYSTNEEVKMKVEPGLNGESVEDTKNFLAGSSRLKEEPNPDSLNEECPRPMIDTGKITYIKQEDDCHRNSSHEEVKIKIEIGLSEDDDVTHDYV